MMLGGRYRLTSPIASGGMAQVWRADDVLLDRAVAAKILHPHLGSDEGFVTRFRREAVAAASLAHPSIVAIYDTISENGLEAIVMELIEGRTLRTLLDEQGALPAADVAHYGSRIAAALDVAHRAGIVHRDIKPANIMVCDDRRVLVTDFGIAKAVDDIDLTQTGTLLGTAKYLAPEQVTGAPIDPRSDLYALGVVLFEALTGQVPFKANTDAATALARLQQDPPRVRSLRPNVAPGLEAIVDRLMAREPAHRFPRAQAVADALLGLGPAGSSPLTAPTGPVGPPTDPPTPPLSGGSSPIDAGPHPSVPPNGGFRPSTTGPNTSGLPPSTTGPVVPSGPTTGGFPPPTTGPINRPGPTTTVDHQRDGDDALDVGSGRVVRSGRSRLGSLFVLGLVLAAMVVVGVMLTDLDDRMGFGSGEVNPLVEDGPGLPIVGVTSFDPQTSDAEKEENEALAPLAIDGDPETVWRTENYRLRRLSGLKDGVGLLLELEESLPLNRIELDTNTTDWEAEIYVGEAFADDGSDWGEPAAIVEAGSNRVVRDLGRVEGVIVLIWIRDTGISGTINRFELSEVIIR